MQGTARRRWLVFRRNPRGQFTCRPYEVVHLSGVCGLPDCAIHGPANQIRGLSDQAAKVFRDIGLIIAAALFVFFVLGPP